jgi:anthranilate 1,2-dioxygenase small subunit
MNMPVEQGMVAQPKQPAPAVREMLENFLVDYCHQLDDGNIDQWTRFFRQDAIYEITTRENQEAGRPIGIMYCVGRGMLEDRILAMQTANVFEAHTYCHMLGRPHIKVQADGRYAVRSNFTVYRTMYTGAVELFTLGKYCDTIVVENGLPLFLHRQVVLDPRLLDTLLVIPL